MKVGDRVFYPQPYEEIEDSVGTVTYLNPDGSVNVAWDDGFDDGLDNKFMPEELEVL